MDGESLRLQDGRGPARRRLRRTLRRLWRAPGRLRRPDLPQQPLQQSDQLRLRLHRRDAGGRRNLRHGVELRRHRLFALQRRLVGVGGQPQQRLRHLDVDPSGRRLRLRRRPGVDPRRHGYRYRQLRHRQLRQHRLADRDHRRRRGRHLPHRLRGLQPRRHHPVALPVRRPGRRHHPQERHALRPGAGPRSAPAAAGRPQRRAGLLRHHLLLRQQHLHRHGRQRHLPDRDRQAERHRRRRQSAHLLGHRRQLLHHP